MQAIYFFRILTIGLLKHKFMLIGLLLPAKVLSILHQLNPAAKERECFFL